LIGVNFSGSSANGTRHGFSISVDIAKRVVSQIIQNGFAESAISGVTLADGELQEELELEKGSMMGGCIN